MSNKALKASIIGLCDGTGVGVGIGSRAALDNLLRDFLGLIGKREMEVKTRNGKGHVEAKGPRLMAKSKSLKLASHARYKKVGTAR